VNSKISVIAVKNHGFQQRGQNTHQRIKGVLGLRCKETFEGVSTEKPVSGWIEKAAQIQIKNSKKPKKINGSFQSQQQTNNS